MRLPRNETGRGLLNRLEKFGYEKTRQSGRHIRLTRQKGEKTHHITIPDHRPLRVGTLSSTLRDISIHLEMTKEDLIKELYS